tara:strand:- start:5662 stop:5823 length:162 start_codon:yes stop_codon:yes gene_type:complete
LVVNAANAGVFILQIPLIDFKAFACCQVRKLIQAEEIGNGFGMLIGQHVVRLP